MEADPVADEDEKKPGFPGYSHAGCLAQNSFDAFENESRSAP
jgi:hypothetical protein